MQEVKNTGKMTEEENGSFGLPSRQQMTGLFCLLRER
jgi:hypothetical protein